MSFVYCPFYKLMINDEIKERIKSQIENFESFSDFSKLNLSLNTGDIDTSSIIYDDIKKQRDIWRNISKLAINLWRDFDYYQQFMFKNQFDDGEYMKRLESLGCVYENGVWRSVCKPSEEVVQTSVFMYCLYEMMVNEKAGTKLDNEECYVDKSHESKFEQSNKPIIKYKFDEWKCGKCQCSNEYTLINCKACGGLYKDGKWRCFKCTMENSCVNDKCGTCEEKIDIIKLKGISLETEVKISENKWKCGGCECINECKFINCKVCSGLLKDGKWICGKCTMENSLDKDKCETCKEKNNLDKI